VFTIRFPAHCCHFLLLRITLHGTQYHCFSSDSHSLSHLLPTSLSPPRTVLFPFSHGSSLYCQTTLVVHTTITYAPIAQYHSSPAHSTSSEMPKTACTSDSLLDMDWCCRRCMECGLSPTLRPDTTQKPIFRIGRNVVQNVKYCEGNCTKLEVLALPSHFVQHLDLS
jgi:hypothetical protein